MKRPSNGSDTSNSIAGLTDYFTPITEMSLLLLLSKFLSFFFNNSKYTGVWQGRRSPQFPVKGDYNQGCLVLRLDDIIAILLSSHCYVRIIQKLILVTATQLIKANILIE